MANFYFRRHDDELCYPLMYWKRLMEEEGLESITLIKAKPVKNDTYMFCNAVGEMGEKSECGRICPDYSPKNGKSGCCKHARLLNEPTEETLTLTNQFMTNE